MGAGMAMLQVVINPLMRVAGGEENYSFYSVLAQLVFGGASYVAPWVFSYLMLNLPADNGSNFVVHTLANLTHNSATWISFYWICGALWLVMILVLLLIKFPKVDLTKEEKVEGFDVVRKLLKNKVILAYFIGIFCYVGTEQGVSVWISKFLSTYFSLDPNTVGAHNIALFWGMQCIGGILGLILLKLFDVRWILGVFIVLGIVFLVMALFGDQSTALFAFPAVGFFTSVMYPGVFSLGMNSVKENHGTFAGILCTGIIGGAVIPFFVGLFGDFLGLKFGMCLVFLALAYMLAVAIFARPLVKNKTIFNHE